jgi:hypothetical protein
VAGAVSQTKQSPISFWKCFVIYLENILVVLKDILKFKPHCFCARSKQSRVVMGAVIQEQHVNAHRVESGRI